MASTEILSDGPTARPRPLQPHSAKWRSGVMQRVAAAGWRGAVARRSPLVPRLRLQPLSALPPALSPHPAPPFRRIFGWRSALSAAANGLRGSAAASAAEMCTPSDRPALNTKASGRKLRDRLRWNARLRPTGIKMNNTAYPGLPPEGAKQPLAGKTYGDKQLQSAL